MYSYQGYGLNIHSSLPLPELRSADGKEPDVIISLGKVAYPHLRPQSAREYCAMTREEAFLFWEDFGTFLVSHGREITIQPFPGVEWRALRLPLLGGGFSVLLHQRGHYVMHASAVSVGDGAVVFLGPKGRGKSSTASAFYAQGHSLLADDLVAVDLTSEARPLVIPGFPQLKLWPETAAFVFHDDPQDLPSLLSGYDKRSRVIERNFAAEPLPLRCVYLLAQGEDLQISKLGSQEAIGELIGNSYIARFGKNALSGVAATGHLRQSASLVNNVPFFQLTRPDSLDLLPAIVAVVEEHVAGL